jgi:hypothetical protein
MKTFKDIREARGDTCVFTFGRFNPPTTGHEKLLDAVATQAKKNPGAPYYVFASHSENAKKDPLPYAKKVAYMKKMFPKHARNIIVDKARNVFEIAVSLHNKGHKAIVMVVGSDRVDEFNSLLNKYNGVEARHGYYGFDEIKVVSAGERDPDAEGVTGMSASKMRAAASENRYENEYDERGKLKKEGFEAGLPSGFADGKKLFADVRKHMGIRESFNGLNYVMTEEDVIRDMYVRGEVLTIGDEVTDLYTGVTGKIIRRGTNYLTFAEEDGTTHKKWLYEIQLAEDCWPGFKQVGMKDKNGKQVPNCVPVDEKQDKDIKDKKGTQPAKYYAKDAEGDEMAKSTKDKRDAHFRKQAAKDDDDPKAYKPAPGDATAKTKPSKYTNKMKKLFPDLYKENADKSLQKKADASGIALGILQKVFDRGVAAWKGGHRPGTTAVQWGHARVNSFISGGKTRTTADADLWKQHKGKSEEKEDPREIGTDARREALQGMTPGQEVKKFSFKEHLDCGTPNCCNECETSSLIESNQYRVGSEKYFEFFQEKRDAYKVGVYSPVGFDKELMEGDIGKMDYYLGTPVPLDCPMQFEEKDVELNKPKVGGPKKYYVYVKDPKTGNVKKVTFGDTTGLKVKLDDKEARKNFAARHNCDQQKDKTKAGYWSCNLPRYAKQLGLSGGGNFFW